MRLKIRYHDILTETQGAILFLIVHDEVWLPKAAVRFCQGNFISVPENLARQKRLDGTPLYHVPEPMEPVYDQRPIADLRFEP